MYFAVFDFPEFFAKLENGCQIRVQQVDKHANMPYWFNLSDRKPQSPKIWERIHFLHVIVVKYYQISPIFLLIVVTIDYF